MNLKYEHIEDKEQNCRNWVGEKPKQFLWVETKG